MLHLPTRTHCKLMPKYRKPKQIQPASLHKIHKNSSSPTQSTTIDYIPETERQTDASTNNESDPSTKDILEIPEPRKKETIDSKTNKTGNKKALSTASEASNKNPVKPSDLDLDPNGPNSQSLKKYNKSFEPTFKKPKCPELLAFTLDRIDDMLGPAIKYINDKNNNQYWITN
ncbi:hypothetical protein K0M31_006827 [Melipona bicolor]|uniref:Uncharacterized protein n=1 Tax=Melipona bicolor TaxID=60889 RepID=A0AA40FT35_9HYME|nr:hypothetical protein K0M31_006827 [Melipona bicolor]